jgi:hypothetical protein
MKTDRPFSPVSDGDITRTILRSFATELNDYVSSDAIVVGAGPAGLICARELAWCGRRRLPRRLSRRYVRPIPSRPSFEMSFRGRDKAPARA